MCCLATMVLLIGCATPSPSSAIEEVLTRQVRCWNNADIDGFMETYVKGDELTFSSGGETRRGWVATRDRYKTRYPDAAAMGMLSFSDLETTPLGRDYALTLGRWKLDRAAGDLEGNFSLVLRREGGEWRIFHDHSSSKEED
jgi:ketosteroid isomerase-like protein